MPIESELKKLEEGKGAEEGEHSVLRRSIGNVEYGKEGKVCLENEKLRLEFNYDFADPNEFMLELEDYDYIDGSSGGVITKLEDWRILRKFVIDDKKSNVKIDILDDLPKHFQVFFNPFSKRENGAASVEENRCLVWGDISSVRGMLTLLHEIGHCVDFEKASDWEKWLETSIDQAKDEEGLNYVFSKERNAWAYALNKIRPLLRSGAFPKDEILKDIHGKQGLLSYCQNIQEILEAMNEMKHDRKK